MFEVSDLGNFLGRKFSGGFFWQKEIGRDFLRVDKKRTLVFSLLRQKLLNQR